MPGDVSFLFSYYIAGVSTVDEFEPPASSLCHPFVIPDRHTKDSPYRDLYVLIGYMYIRIRLS